MSSKNHHALRRAVRNEGLSIIRQFLADVCAGSLKSRLQFAWRIITKKF